MSLLRLRTLLRMRPQDTNAIDEIGGAIDGICGRQPNTYQLAKVGRSPSTVKGAPNAPCTTCAIRCGTPTWWRSANCFAASWPATAHHLRSRLEAARPPGARRLLRAVKSEGFPDLRSAALAALREAVLSALPGEVVVNANAVYARLTELVEPPGQPRLEGGRPRALHARRGHARRLLAGRLRRGA